MNEPRAKSKRLTLIGTIALVMVLLPCGGLLWFRTQGERALQARLTELRAKGEKLTIVELFGEMTAEDTKRHNELNHRLSQLTSIPGWSSDISWMQFSAPGRARAICNDPDGIKGLKNGSNALLVSWANASAAAQVLSNNLALLRAQLTTPPHRSGGGYEPYPMFTLRPNFVRMRTAAFWFAAAAALEIHQGRTAEALTNLTALVDLASAYDQEPGLTTFMIRMAIANLASAACWDSLQSDQWTETQLANLQDRWERWDASARLARGFENDRAYVFTTGDNWRRDPSLSGSIYQSLNSPKVFESALDLGWKKVLAANDLLSYLNLMQVRIEAARKLEHGVPLSEIQPIVDATGQQLVQRSWQDQWLSPFTSIASVQVSKAMQTIARTETQRQMLITAIALKRHHLRSLRYPSTLEELVPHYLRTLPIDGFSGKPLQYRTNGTGGWLLYSVGTNGRDDGGNGDPLKPSKQWGLWDSLDAVWPTPANP